MISLKDKQILVTGGAGFVGSNLVRRLVKDGCRVVVLEKPAADLWRLKDIIHQLEIVYFDLGFGQGQELIKKIPKAEIIYHLASAGVNQSETNCELIMRSNLLGSSQMLELARALKVERFIYSGSCFEYGEGVSLSEKSFPAPISEYDVSKLAGWFLANSFFHRYALPVVSLRLFNLYGPYEGAHRLVPYAVNNALKSKDIKLTLGEQKRDFVFIDDLVEGFIAAGNTENIIGSTFNLASGKLTSVKDVVNMIIELTNSESKPIFGALEYRKSEIMILSGDPSKAEKELGWSVKNSLKDGLKKTIEWFKENKDNPK